MDVLQPKWLDQNRYRVNHRVKLRPAWWDSKSKIFLKIFHLVKSLGLKEWEKSWSQYFWALLAIWHTLIGRWEQSFFSILLIVITWKYNLSNYLPTRNSFIGRWFVFTNWRSYKLISWHISNYGIWSLWINWSFAYGNVQVLSNIKTKKTTMIKKF